MNGFRCAAASLARSEEVPGTASTVRAFLLVEHDGPWGQDAWRDSRLPDVVRDELPARLRAARVRGLMIRRHRRTDRSPGIRVFAAHAHPERPWLETTVLTGHADLAGLDLTGLGQGRSVGLDPAPDPLFLVCTHGRHDACCAELGRPLAAALTASHPAQTWEVSHIGGDRFAGNLLVLPHGLYHGRVGPQEAPALAQGLLEGRISLPHLRGRSAYPMPVQYAEWALRSALEETGLDGVRVVHRETQGSRTEVRFDVGGATYAVVVERALEAPEQLTCRGGESPVPAFRTVSVSLPT